jgi:hypothetical protein
MVMENYEILTTLLKQFLLFQHLKNGDDLILKIASSKDSKENMQILGFTIN